MKTIILHFKFFIFVIIATLFSTTTFSQCTITTTTNATALTCGSGALSACNGVLNIGNGSTSMSLVMNTALNLSCLGPIQLVVKNGASLDFSSGNDYLTLAAGSSIVFEGTGTLIGGSCNASERIYIGNDLIASCNGGGSGADYNFAQLIAIGGFNFVKTTTSTVCGSGTSSIGVSTFPVPTSSTVYNLYTAASGGVPIATVTSSSAPYSGILSTPSIAATSTYYISATTGSNTTPRKVVTINVNGIPNNISNGFSATTICAGGSPQLTYDAEDATFTMPYSIIYRNNTTGLQYSASITSASPFVFTPEDNPISNTGYTLVSISNATCTNANVVGFGDSGANLVVRPLPTATISSGTNVCMGAISPLLTFTNPQTVAVTISYTVNSVSQTINVAAGSLATISIPTTVAATFVYNLTSVKYQSTATCPNAVTGSATVIVSASPSIPSITTLTQPTCVVTTGIITVGIQNGNDAYSFDNGLTYQSSNTKSLLNAGSYNVIIRNAGGCSSAPLNVQINPVVTNKWTGSWSTGANPVATEKIEFAGNYLANIDVVGCSCEVQSGNITFLSGKTLTLTNDLKVTGGSLTFEDSASLVQINNVTNTGNVSYKRITQTIVSNFDYTYWSSPVTPQTLFNVSPLTLGDKFYSFNGATDSWVQEASSTVMTNGVGYIIRGPQNFMAPSPPSFYQATFIGVPNNGNISIPIGSSSEASYLLGNPYPSALDADTFLRDNPILDGTLYFWTHNTAIGTNVSNPGSGVYAYSGDDYASYNLTGGVATNGEIIVKGGIPAVVGGIKPSGKIGAGQGFFLTTMAAGNVNFTNSMRVGVGSITGDNSQFFKTQSTKTAQVIEKNRLWLDLFNSSGSFKQALIGYVNGASNTIDAKFDGASFDGNATLDFYSINSDKNLVIQGRALPFDRNDSVALGYKTTVEGSFTIAIDQVDGFFKRQEVFLEDKLLNIIHDLKKQSYTFTTEKGRFNTRFIIRYTTKEALVNKITDALDAILVATKNKVINIASVSGVIDYVLLFDLSGRQIYSKLNVADKELVINSLPSSNRTFIVKVKLQNGQISTKKIIY